MLARFLLGLLLDYPNIVGPLAVRLAALAPLPAALLYGRYAGVPGAVFFTNQPAQPAQLIASTAWTRCRPRSSAPCSASSPVDSGRALDAALGYLAAPVLAFTRRRRRRFVSRRLARDGKRAACCPRHSHRHGHPAARFLGPAARLPLLAWGAIAASWPSSPVVAGLPSAILAWTCSMPKRPAAQYLFLVVRGDLSGEIVYWPGGSAAEPRCRPPLSGRDTWSRW